MVTIYGRFFFGVTVGREMKSQPFYLCTHSGVELVILRGYRKWPKSWKKLLVVSLATSRHFLEILAVDTDRCFINAGPD